MKMDFQPDEYEGATVRLLLSMSPSDRDAFAQKFFTSLANAGADEGIPFFMATVMFADSEERTAPHENQNKLHR